MDDDGAYDEYDDDNNTTQLYVPLVDHDSPNESTPICRIHTYIRSMRM